MCEVPSAVRLYQVNERAQSEKGGGGSELRHSRTTPTRPRSLANLVVKYDKGEKGFKKSKAVTASTYEDLTSVMNKEHSSFFFFHSKIRDVDVITLTPTP